MLAPVTSFQSSTWVQMMCSPHWAVHFYYVSFDVLDRPSLVCSSLLLNSHCGLLLVIKLKDALSSISHFHYSLSIICFKSFATSFACFGFSKQQLLNTSAFGGCPGFRLPQPCPRISRRLPIIEIRVLSLQTNMHMLCFLKLPRQGLNLQPSD